MIVAYSMDADSHVQAVVVDLLPDFRYNIQHLEPQLHHIVGLFGRQLPVFLVGQTHRHVAVADRVELE